MYHWKAETPIQAAPSKEPGRIGVQHEAVLEAVLEAACQENRSPPGYPLKYFCHNFLNISLFLIILVIFNVDFSQYASGISGFSNKYEVIYLTLMGRCGRVFPSLYIHTHIYT